MSTCSATPAAATRRTAAQTPNRSRISSSGDTGRGSNLDAANAAFTCITRRTGKLVIDGAALGAGLPHRMINLSELNEVLFHPSTSLNARNVVWRHLVARSRTCGQDWIVGAIGVAMPALKAMSVKLANGFGADRVEVEDDLLTGFLHSIAVTDVAAGDRVLSRLCNPAYATVRRALRQQKRNKKKALEFAETTVAATNHGDNADDEYSVLRRAVSRGVISEAESDLIAHIHLENVSIADYAKATGREYFAVAKNRQRAVARLDKAHKNGELAPEFDLREWVIEQTTTTVLDKNESGGWRHGQIR